MGAKEPAASFFRKQRFVGLQFSTICGLISLMTNALELADAIGRKKIASALGVGPTAVSNAVVRGWFPSSWFVGMTELAEKCGQSCPPELFGMKSISSPSTSAPSQEAS